MEKKECCKTVFIQDILTAHTSISISCRLLFLQYSLLYPLIKWHFIPVWFILNSVSVYFFNTGSPKLSNEHLKLIISSDSCISYAYGGTSSLRNSFFVKVYFLVIAPFFNPTAWLEKTKVLMAISFPTINESFNLQLLFSSCMRSVKIVCYCNGICFYIEFQF